MQFPMLKAPGNAVCFRWSDSSGNPLSSTSIPQLNGAPCHGGRIAMTLILTPCPHPRPADGSDGGQLQPAGLGGSTEPVPYPPGSGRLDGRASLRCCPNPGWRCPW